MSRVDRQAVLEKYGGRCAYCGRTLTAFQVDHLHPRHLGGGDELENLVPACQLCNRYKVTYSVEQLREQLSLIPSRLERQSNYRPAVAHGLILPTGKTPTFLLDGESQ